MTRLPESFTLGGSPVETGIEVSRIKSGSAESSADRISVIKQSGDSDMQSDRQDIVPLLTVKQIRSLEEETADISTTAVESGDKQNDTEVIIRTPQPEEVSNLYYDYFVIPKGHVWLAGDNVANSTDSR